MTITQQPTPATGQIPQVVATVATTPIAEHDHRWAMPAFRLPRPMTARMRAQRATVGTGFLGIAAMTMAVLMAVFGLARFTVLWHENRYPDPSFAAIAWLVLSALFVVVALTARSAGDRLSRWIALAIMASLAIVVVLDVAAAWNHFDLGRDLTAAPGASLVLLAMVGVCSARGVAAATAALAAVLGALVLLSWSQHPMAPGAIDSSISMLIRTVAPPLVGAIIVSTFRRIMKRELERVLVQSTVSAPRFAVGMLASEELARLDLAAEQLLDDVATGRSRLPLNPASAQAAASLATELRLHLIEGRRQTWLYHAISESELLGRTVALSDPESLAGLLDPRQRDGLLQAVWLLVGDSPERSRRSAFRVAIELTVGQSRPDEKNPKTLHVPIVLVTTGVARSRVDPATWDAVRKVGRHVDTGRGGSLSIEIDCLVDRPKEH